MSETAAEHDQLVAEITGGLAPDRLPAFGGSDRLRPDGRPRPEFRAELRRIPDLRNAVAVVLTLLAPIAVVWGAVTVDRWYGYVAAFALMGTIFPRMFILHHEAAHRLLFSNRRINDLVGEKVLGWIPFGDGGNLYRLVHTQHHRDEFGPKEPDLALYARYPVSQASLRRKLTRDASGVSGWKNLKPALKGLFRSGYRRRALRFLSGQVLVFALFALSGHPWLYLFLWFLPWMTYWRVANRLRALAEHAGMTRSDDRRRTTHHVDQHLPARFLFVPYHVGYHLAHHVDSGIPMWNLPKLHAALVEDGYLPPELVHRNYLTFWRQLAR